MYSQNSENQDNIANQSNNPNMNVLNENIGKAINPIPSNDTTFPNQTKINKIVQSKNIPVANPIYSNEPPKVLKPIYPDQSKYPNQIPKNTEHINKQYNLKDIVKKTQKTVNFIKALSSTVVKPVIVSEVTTLKPIIAPVKIKDPVNFFEGQPLSQEDSTIQNFFKNTTPVSDNSQQYYQNYYSFSQQFPTQQQNNNIYNSNYSSQAVQYPSQEFSNQGYVINRSVQMIPQQGQVNNNNIFINNSVQYYPPQQMNNVNKTVISRSFQMQPEQPINNMARVVQSKKQNTGSKISEKQVEQPQFKTQNQTNIVQTQKVIGQNNFINNQNLNKSLKPVVKLKNVIVNNTLEQTYSSPNKQSQVESKNNDEEDGNERVPRNSIRK